MDCFFNSLTTCSCGIDAVAPTVVHDWTSALSWLIMRLKGCLLGGVNKDHTLCSGDN